MRKLYIICLIVLIACVGCQWKMRSDDEKTAIAFAVDRFDQIELRYLTTGDFSALQQMKTGYPVETRTLIEDVLKLGRVDDADINQRFLHFFQDSTLQTLIEDVNREYADMADVDKELGRAFDRLTKLLPHAEVPHVYTQIGSLDQSIIVSDSLLGISLDKYLGENHPVYLYYGYTQQQRSTMTRAFIVPDCIGFYLLSLYPLSDDATDDDRHWHMSKIQHVVNQVMGRPVFSRDAISQLENYQRTHASVTIDSLLRLKSL